MYRKHSFHNLTQIIHNFPRIYTNFVVNNSKLLGRNGGGSLIELYPLSEYFTATLTQAQAASMSADPCAYAVEPNYVIRARGNPSTNFLRLGAHSQEQSDSTDQSRRLGIPEFNRLDENPPNWGLERVSTRGQRNGKYIWVSEEIRNIYAYTQ